ncbi:MAG: hypothetical protein A2X45_07810 [Lentisphaerae bacterium GWF2_50_93]|nr:MAG: hypothetical protein A2X45_07810 [Lentisphaerae bacterium GWF2_50_93]
MNLGAQENAEKAAPAAVTPVKQVKLLAIGNSFSANTTKFLKDIVKDSGNCELVFGHAMIGGCPMEKHWNLAQKNESNPEDPEGKPYMFNGKKAGLKEMLTGEKWQVVTIQQFSVISYKVDSYRPHAKNLYDYIKKYAPDAEVVIHQTWAYRSDDKGLFKDDFNSVKMYQQVTNAYYTIAKELGCRVIPVGTAFQLAYESPEWEFKRDESFDYKNPKHPELPKELHSLHAGYFWKLAGENKKLSYDSHHANFAGEYLGGCVWFEFLFKEDARNIKFKPKNMSEEDAAVLRNIAHKVVTEGAKPKAGE